MSILSRLKHLELLCLERAPASFLGLSVADRDPDRPDDEQAVAKLLGYLDGQNRLEVLRLDARAFGDESARAVAKLPLLRILMVADAEALTDEGLAAIGECERVEVLDLRVDYRITAEGLGHLRFLPQLRILKLWDSTSLDDTAIDALKALPALEEFSANCSGLSARGIERFAELPQLRRLTLYNVRHDSAVSRLETKRPDLRVTSAYTVPALP